MDFRSEIKQELKEIQDTFSTGISGQPFEVSPQYFDEMPSQILDTIKTEDFANSLTKELPYSLPGDYWNSFAEDMLLLVKEVNTTSSEEINHLSSLLVGLKDKPTYELPDEDYFEEQVGAAKIIKFPSTYHAEKRIKWMRWVAAAAVLFIFSIGGFQFLYQSAVNSTTASDEAIQSALASISDEAILEYLQETDKAFAYDNHFGVSEKDYQFTESEQEFLNSLSDSDIENLLGY